jgi:nucleoside-diphosphate-sugar epimerase
MGVTMKVKFEPARKLDVPVPILSVERARQQLGRTPTTTFGDGIAKTLAWWEAARA